MITAEVIMSLDDLSSLTINTPKGMPLKLNYRGIGKSD